VIEFKIIGASAAEFRKELLDVAALLSRDVEHTSTQLEFDFKKQVTKAVENEAAVSAPASESGPVVKRGRGRPPKVSAPVVSAPVVEATVVSAPVVEAPVVQAPVVSAPVVETPVQSPVVEAPAPSAFNIVTAQKDEPEQVVHESSAKIEFADLKAVITKVFGHPSYGPAMVKQLLMRFGAKKPQLLEIHETKYRDLHKACVDLLEKAES